MNAHEMIDRFSARSPRFKIAVAFAVVCVVVGSLAGAFWLGKVKGREWADSEYLQKSAEREKQIAVHEANAQRHMKGEESLAAENFVLRKQYEALAEAQKQADTKQEQKQLTEIARIEKERAERFREIDMDQNLDSQLCATCRLYSAGGLKLSGDLCRRCGEQK
jgi:rubrerythrin